jgi:hypothetical protein
MLLAHSLPVLSKAGPLTTTTTIIINKVTVMFYKQWFCMLCEWE